ncbi:MAG TPA: DnaJ domain-containing protein [Planctomycetota bacterium]|nr:DnaJ domain-containing protein [Planctomycetota bacterium]
MILPEGGKTVNYYYEVLEVKPTSPPEEIKSSFRRLAKRFHPDRSREAGTDDKMRLIIKAYDVLINENERRLYDQHLRQEAEKNRDPYREHLKSKPDDPAAQARLILYSLLNEAGDEAIKIYERMKSKYEGFDLANYLEEKDYLDCEFLLGEAYESAGKWEKALDLYERVYAEEREMPVRFFLEEVKDRIRDIYCKRLARALPSLDAVKIYQKVLDMGLAKKAEAYIHKKIAESYHKFGDLRKAKHHLAMAFELEPRLKGAQKICEKLGYKRPKSAGRGGKS